eukprot:3728168-Alexandrium_andersonii.AAC.1
MHGGFAGGSATGASWGLGLDLEDSRAKGLNMVGVSIDIYKCFDQLPRPLDRQLLQRMGAPAHMVTPWWSFVQSLRIVNVLADSVGI